MKKQFKTMDDVPMVLSVEDLMPILGIGRNTAYGLVKRGEISCIHIGRQLRITKTELQRFMKNNGKSI
jgi:DNA binding domain, excisionase family